MVISAALLIRILCGEVEVEVDVDVEGGVFIAE